MSEQLFDGKLVVGPAPHVATKDSIQRIMWSVIIALVPALIVAAIYFGYYALMVVAVSMISAVLCEAAIQRFRGVPVTVSDGSAALTGLLLAFTLPPNVPLYLPVIGSVFAIAIAKQAFGGLGFNIWNPALAGRAFLLAAYSGQIVMTKWPILSNYLFGNITVDAVTKATPCAILKEAPLTIFSHYSLMDLFIGRIPGSIGETSALALIAGGIFLIVKGYVNWRLPLSYIATVMIFTVFLPVSDGAGGTIFLWKDVVLQGGWLDLVRISTAEAFSGGLMLGAFFMATDMVTSPLTGKGQTIFGVGCGILVALIRLYGGYPEGVCYSILIMNTAVWVIDRLTVPRFFGVKGHVSKDA
ncbi:MAG TPA: RnfABCDGE type electron transport complex subunit D [bacterium]|jgi:electron transport complex protein RnfD|nr:RnfABCDGE type electron transport complex subunit D [Myxococcales bacterium]OQA61680.1 MAG: Electron transport complex protein RnfD [bacterium ADurb.Bin270]HPW46064.1 RnfABCDGE type electron transport complex subunit D [bacterium]